MTDPGIVVCPHHGVPPDWNWTPHRVMGRLTITYWFPCCDYTLQVNHLPVPGIHEPLPESCVQTHPKRIGFSSSEKAVCAGKAKGFK